MADTTVTNETAATTPTGAELVRIVQGGSSKKTTAAVLGHQLRGAKVYMTADDTTVNATSNYTLSWDAARYDTDTFWSAGAPTRLTIPAGLGITHVDVTACVRIDATTASTFISLGVQRFSSADVLQENIGNVQLDKGATSVFVNVSAVGVQVSDGDYFTAYIDEESDNSITVTSGTNQTTLAVVVRGMSVV